MLFIGATNFDRKFRAFDAATGRLLWQVTLPFAANTTPATYEAGGRQYVLVAAGGGKSREPSGGMFIAYRLPARRTERQVIVITRRQFSQSALAGVVLPALTGRWVDASPVAGVRLGVQTYSFRELTKQGTAEALNVIIASMKACGVDECELWSPQIELAPPAGRDAPAAAQATAREAMRDVAAGDADVATYEGVRKRFADAGMTVYAYNLSFNDSFTDDEIDRGFEAAKALGAEVITASTTLRVAKRLVPFAEKHKVPVAMHNHSNITDPNEFATPASFTTALAMSPLFRINLDIGHFTAANFDALAFLEQHHDRITNLHLKDRKKNQGDNVPWGSGDTPIRQALAWLKQKKSPVRAYVEYEYPGTRGAVAEVTACVDYAKQALHVVTRRLGMGLVGPGFVGAHHIDAVRRLGFVDVVAIAASTEASAAGQGAGARRAEGLRQLRGAGRRPRHRRRARHDAQRPARRRSSTRRSRTASTWSATSRWRRPRPRRGGCATRRPPPASCTP